MWEYADKQEACAASRPPSISRDIGIWVWPPKNAIQMEIGPALDSDFEDEEGGDN